MGEELPQNLPGLRHMAVEQPLPVQQAVAEVTLEARHVEVGDLALPTQRGECLLEHRPPRFLRREPFK